MGDIEWQQDGKKVRAHYSSLSLHRKCPQAWMYSYLLGLREDHETLVAPERDTGIWWSVIRAAEALERGRALDSLRGRPRGMRTVDGMPEADQATITVPEVFDMIDVWWTKQQLIENAEEEWKKRMGEDAPTRLRKLFTRWMDTWPERKYERPIALEMGWGRELPKPRSDNAWDPEGENLTIKLVGYIDEVYEDTRRGLIVARDNKTSKQMGIATAVDDLMDSQLMLYAWGAQPRLTEWGVGPIKATAYDRSSSVKGPTPILTKSGKLSTTSKNYDLATYLAWVDNDGKGQQYEGLKKDGTGAGVYVAEQAEIDRITTRGHLSMFHQRTLTPLSIPMVRAHLRSAVDTAADIWRTQLRFEMNKEVARNISKDGCKYCSFATLDRAQMLGGPDGEYELAQFGLRHASGGLYLRDGKVTQAEVTA